MRILIHGLNNFPELTGIGKYSGEMAEWLAAQGHEVRVVTAPPYYPQWKVADGYSGREYRREIIGVALPPHNTGVLVFRCPLWVPAKPSGITRVLHLASFALSSLPVMLKQVFWRPDVVWVVEPALLCTPAAWLTAKLSGAKTWLHVQDFEVDAAFDLGLVKGVSLRRWVLAIERWLMQGFDRVSTISARMFSRLLDKGVSSARCVLFPNWVEIPADSQGCMACDFDYRSQLGIPNGVVVALYSGNMGKKQGLETLAVMAEQLRGDNIVFVFCGNGAGRDDLISRCANLSNVRFLDLQPVERLPEFLAFADIHLLPQRADAADLVMPSKLTGMLASARPMVAGAHIGTEVARVMEGRGLVVEPENAAAFAAAVKLLAQDSSMRQKLGEAGRLYAIEHLDRDVVLARFEQELRRLIAS